MTHEALILVALILVFAWSVEMNGHQTTFPIVPERLTPSAILAAEGGQDAEAPGLVFNSTSDTQASRDAVQSARDAVLAGTADREEIRMAYRDELILVAKSIASQYPGRCDPRVCMEHRTPNCDPCCVAVKFPALWEEMERVAHE